MDSPMTTTPTSSDAKFAQLEEKHTALQTQVDSLAKQIQALNINPVRIQTDDLKIETTDPVDQVDPKLVKKSKSTPAFALPWTGIPIKGCCQGIRSNYDTYTQCHQACAKDNIYCKTCAKNCGEDGVPKDGNVESRSTITKKIKPYINFMNAKKLSKQDVIDEAAKFDLVLCDEIFEKPSIKGRPKKSVTDDSDDEPCPSIQITGLLANNQDSPKSP